MKRREEYSDIYKTIQEETDFPLPEALQPEKIAAAVQGETVLPKKRHIARYVSLAAALVLVTLAGAAGWKLTNSTKAIVDEPLLPQASAPLAEAEDEYLRIADYKEIEAFFAEKQKDYKSRTYGNVLADGGINFGMKDAAPESAAYGSAMGSANTNGASDAAQKTPAAHGETNTQVKDIDEADILKNDGNYLYIVRSRRNFVDIVDIRDPKSLCSAAHIESKSEEENRTVSEIYVHGDTLVILYSVYAADTNGKTSLYDTCYAYDLSAGKSRAEVYDITDRTAPKLRFDYAVDGSILSSRMDGNTLILLTEYNVPIYKDETDLRNACVPCVYENGEKTRFPADSVRIVEGTEDTAYLTVSLIDTEAESANAQTKAVLGGGSNVYCSKDTLLIAQTDNSEAISTSGTGKNETVSFDSSKVATRLFAFDLENGAAYKGSARVRGTVLNQFSMDSFNGFYRIATTESPANGSLVTVLNENLEVVGELGGIAKGESIYAVRFMGDTAYLVTFYQTDPLFIVDLSDPAAPKITGELKIPGFSNYLHPYSDTLLIGIGEDGSSMGANGQLKVSLFDVSDKQNPKEISKAVYSGGEYSASTARDTHKAYLSLPESGELAIPVAEYTRNGTVTAYASILTVENGKLRVTGTYTPLDKSDIILRVSYAGETVFTLSDHMLTAFDKATGERLSAVEYNAEDAEGTVVIE